MILCFFISLIISIIVGVAGGAKFAFIFSIVSFIIAFVRAKNVNTEVNDFFMTIALHCGICGLIVAIILLFVK